MKIPKILTLLTIITLFVSCNSDDPVQTATITMNFTQNWDGTAINFNTIQYTNANGEQLSVTRLRYLISKMELHASDGSTVELEGYNLIDLANDNTLNFTSNTVVPNKTYTSFSFNFGFDAADNAENYADLNSASWNWPDMLGGGYHNMQLEGQYINNTMPAANTYAYHMGKALVSTGTYEDNHIAINLPLNNQTFAGDASIELKMNIAEWFKNPNQWDLNVYNNALMGNYAAQILMQENGASVFSLGTINP